MHLQLSTVLWRQTLYARAYSGLRYTIAIIGGKDLFHCVAYTDRAEWYGRIMWCVRNFYLWTLLFSFQYKPVSLCY